MSPLKAHLARSTALLVVALAAGCGGDPPARDVPPADAAADRPDAPTEESPSGDAADDVARIDASEASVDVLTVDLPRVDVVFADLPSTVAECQVPPGDPRREAQETRCDGVDNDCDGRVDLLLPTGANACSTGAMGVCASGWAACEGTARRCLAPSPSPESSDGLDNDCDGRVDNVAADRGGRPRALVLAPRYLWTKGGDEIRALASVLDQWGIPYDLPAPDSDWVRGVTELGRYNLAIVPGYLDGEVLNSATRVYLEAFARRGGVLIIHKPVGAQTELLGLAGLRRSTRRTDVTSLRIEGAAVAAVRSLDSPEERALVVTDDVAARSIEAFVLEPDPAAQTVSAARAYAGATDLGSVLTRRPLDRGAIYTLGHDLHTWSHYRCYVNCFEPAGDVLGLVLRDAMREASSGHSLFVHTLPGPEDGLLLLTHDIDALEAARAGPWGDAGAVQMAATLRNRGARGTFFFTTDYVSGTWDPATVSAVCAFGMCPPGAHSVRHFSTPATQPMGDCRERAPEYRPMTPAQATLCGEVRASLQLVREASGMPPVAWRSPFLEVHPRLYDVLSEQGVVVDSSFAIGDFKNNLPLSLASTFFRQDLFHHRAIDMVAVTLDDGIARAEGGGTTRVELQASNSAGFVSAWTYAMLRNAANGAHTTLLVHPSFGAGTSGANLGAKLAAVDRLLQAAARRGLRTDLRLDEFAAFWRAREAADVDAEFDPARGYNGSVTVGRLPVRGLTLEFGDAIQTFVCPACGPTTISGRRVTIAGTFLAGQRATFTAVPR